MLSPFIRLYVINSVWKERMRVQKDYVKLLEDELTQFSDWTGKIKYAWFWSAGVHVPNASATIPGHILINAEWANRIVTENNNPNMHDAFRMTVFHEVTHQENDFFLLEFLTVNSKFVNWVNEIYADFGGAKKAFDGDVDRTLKSLTYKLLCKKKRDKDTRSHPSWRRRIQYIENYDFDDKLIAKVALDVGCKNSRLIGAIVNHFDTIKLRRGI